MRKNLPLYVLTVVTIVVAASGCDSVKKLGSTPPPEPPPSPKEIAQPILAEANMSGRLPPQGTRLSNAEMGRTLTVLRKARTKHAPKEDPEADEENAFNEEVLKIINRKISDRLEEAEETKLWKHVLLYSDAHLIFHPESKRYKIPREIAVTELKKPEVTIRALFEDADTEVWTAILDFHIPLTDETFKVVELEMGNVVHGMRFVNVIGLERGIRMKNESSKEMLNVYFPHSL